MSKKDRKVQAEDIAVLYDKVWGFIHDDRERLVDMFEDLKDYIVAEKARYAENGDTLAKYGDLLVKQSSQLIDLIKIAKKSHEDEGELTDDDLKMIEEEIKEEAKEEKASGATLTLENAEIVFEEREDES